MPQNMDAKTPARMTPSSYSASLATSLPSAAWRIEPDHAEAKAQHEDPGMKREDRIVRARRRQKEEHDARDTGEQEQGAVERQRKRICGRACHA